MIVISLLIVILTIDSSNHNSDISTNSSDINEHQFSDDSSSSNIDNNEHSW